MRRARARAARGTAVSSDPTRPPQQSAAGPDTRESSRCARRRESFWPRVSLGVCLPCRARSTGMSVPRRARRRSAGARLLRTREVARVATSPPSPHEPTDGHVGMGPREWVVCSLECPRAARLVHEGCDRGGRLRAAREAARKSRGGPRVFL